MAHGFVLGVELLGRGWWDGVSSNIGRHEHPRQKCEACPHPGIPIGSELSSTTWVRFGPIFLKSNGKNGQSHFHHELLSSSLSLIPEESSITWEKCPGRVKKTEWSWTVRSWRDCKSWEMKRKLAYRTWQILRMSWSSRVNWWEISSQIWSIICRNQKWRCCR